MSQFPLYADLKKNITNIDINKTDFIKNFKQIDKKSHGLLYALIKSYQFDHKINPLSSSLPFNGIKLKTKGSIKFSLNNFPEDLQKILYKFILLDINKTNNDTNNTM